MIRRQIYLGIALLCAAVAMTARADKSEVPPDALVVKVGQTVYVTFTANGDTLVNPTILPAASPTEPTVTFQLTQAGPTRTLFVTNGYAKPLAYRAIARLRARRREFELTVNSVRGGMQSVITLGEPFDELALFEFHLTSTQ